MVVFELVRVAFDQPEIHLDKILFSTMVGARTSADKTYGELEWVETKWQNKTCWVADLPYTSEEYLFLHAVAVCD